MLSQERIPIGKLKQAYELSGHDIDALMAKLLPNSVFPYALWQNAYTEFWQWSIREHAQRYRFKEPIFPDAGALPEKYFPTSLHRMLIVRFFDEIAKLIEIAVLEKGFDYIIDATYGGDVFPFKEQKESLFAALRQEERSFANFQRTSGRLIIDSMQAVDHFCISESFFDTIVVDKYAALSHIILSGYSFRGPVKGVSLALVEHITAKVFAIKNNDEVRLEPVNPSQNPDELTSQNYPTQNSSLGCENQKTICTDTSQHVENNFDSSTPKPTLEATPEQEPTAPTLPPAIFVDVTPEGVTAISQTLTSGDTVSISSSLDQSDIPLEGKEDTTNQTPQNQALPPFHFKRELLNKTPEAVYEILHAEKVHPRVIARVLYSRCGVTTQLGLSAILGSYPRKIQTYLAETESMTIIDL